MLKALKSRPQTAAASVLILLGLALRLRQYLTLRSLWLDEAMLALNIVNRDFGGLFKPLDYDQGAPLGFLLLEKLAATLWGSGELPLRLLPFIAGCSALILFYFYLCRVTNTPGLLTALALFAVSAPQIYYSSEVKQYASDVFIALLLLYLASRAWPSPSALPQRGRGLTALTSLITHYSLLVTGFLAIWFSHPALFVLAAIGVVMLLDNLIQRNRAGIISTLLMGAIWLLSLALLYFTSLRQLSANPFLLGFWGDYFMPLSLQAPGWLLSTFQETLKSPTGLTVPWPLPALIMLFGLIALFRRHWQTGLTLSLVIIATLGASALGKYPFAGRMILFLAPVFIAFLGAGIDAILESGRLLPALGRQAVRLQKGVAILLAVAILYGPVVASAQNFLRPKTPEHIRPALAFLQANRKPGDVIYVYAWALPAVRYYAPQYGLSANDIIPGNRHEDDPQALLAEFDRLKGNKRAWFLFSHVYEKGDYNEKDSILAHLDEIGDKKREFREPGTAVYLYLYDLLK